MARATRCLVGGPPNTSRNKAPPTLLNSVYNRYVNWDGKFANTPQLVLAVMANPRNMNMQDEAVLVARLEAVPEYRGIGFPSAP